MQVSRIFHKLLHFNKTNLKILWIYLVHQIIVLGGIYLDKTLYAQRGVSKQLAVIWPSLANWDGEWYLKIAASGYEAHSVAFFPLYPLAIRLFHALGCDFLTGALLVSNLSLLGGCFIFYRLLALDYPQDDCLKGLWYLLLFPTSFFFNAVYTEAFFLWLTLTAFYLARRGVWLGAGIAGMLAATTRNLGVWLIIPLALEYWVQRDYDWRRIDWSLAWLLLVPLGLGGYMLYLARAFGDPLGFVKVQSSWLRTFTYPWQAFAITIRHLLHGRYWDRNLLDFSFAVLALGMLAASFRKMRLSYLVFAVIGFLMPLWAGSSRAGLFSMPRFVAVLFPLHMGLALRWSDSQLERGSMALGAGWLVYLSISFARLKWVA